MRGVGETRGGSSIEEPSDNPLDTGDPEPADDIPSDRLADAENSESSTDIRHRARNPERRSRLPPQDNRDSSQDSRYYREDQPVRSTGEPIHGCNAAGQFVATPGNTIGYEIRRPIEVALPLSNLLRVRESNIFASSPLRYRIETEPSSAQFDEPTGSSRLIRSPMPEFDSFSIG